MEYLLFRDAEGVKSATSESLNGTLECLAGFSHIGERKICQIVALIGNISCSLLESSVLMTCAGGFVIPHRGIN